MASEAARQKYPDRERAHPFEPMASLANAQYVIEREREAYDAGRVDALRDAAQIVQDVARQGGGLQTAEETLLREAASIEKEARG